MFCFIWGIAPERRLLLNPAFSVTEILQEDEMEGAAIQSFHVKEEQIIARRIRTEVKKGEV